MLPVQSVRYQPGRSVSGINPTVHAQVGCGVAIVRCAHERRLPEECTVFSSVAGHLALKSQGCLHLKGVISEPSEHDYDATNPTL
jgi:hypothetical protein